MARRGSKGRGQRDDISPSLAELLAPLESPLEPIRLSQLVPPTRFWPEVQDDRQFNPEGRDRSRLSWSGNVAGARLPVGRGSPPIGMGFNVPKEVVHCARRQSRREVMFALRRRRKGAGAARRRRSFWSNVKC